MGKAERPYITNDRYSNLNSNDRRREYQRDLTLYEQNELLEKLANTKQDVIVNVDSRLDGEYVDTVKEQNELLRDQIMLQNLKGKQKQEYLKKIQDKLDTKRKDEELKARIKDDFNRGETLTKTLTQFYLEVGKATADTLGNLVRKSKNKSNKISDNISAIWFTILIFGGLGIALYYTLSNSWGYTCSSIPLILYIILLVAYPILATKLNNSNKKSYIDTKTEMDKFDKDYRQDIVKFIDFRRKDETTGDAIVRYKKYCIDYIRDIEYKYNNKPEVFTEFDKNIFINTIDKIIRT